jgi:hypothetical protein
MTSADKRLKARRERLAKRSVERLMNRVAELGLKDELVNELSAAESYESMTAIAHRFLSEHGYDPYSLLSNSQNAGQGLSDEQLEEYRRNLLFIREKKLLLYGLPFEELAWGETRKKRYKLARRFLAESGFDPNTLNPIKRKSGKGESRPIREEDGSTSVRAMSGGLPTLGKQRK